MLDHFIKRFLDGAARGKSPCLEHIPPAPRDGNAYSGVRRESVLCFSAAQRFLVFAAGGELFFRFLYTKEQQCDM